MPPSWTDRTSARRRNDRERRMYTNKKTIANSPYEEALSELRAAVPNLQAIADRAFALAVANEFEGPRRRNIERVGIRAVDLITAISGLAQW